MKNQPFISRLAESAALILMWPLAVIASIFYLAVSITIEIAVRVAGVWR